MRDEGMEAPRTLGAVFRDPGGSCGAARLRLCLPNGYPGDIRATLHLLSHGERRSPRMTDW